MQIFLKNARVGTRNSSLSGAGAKGFGSNLPRCKCFPKHCSSIMKSYRGFAHMEGKCLSSTIMFGSKSATIFGTHFDEQKRNLVWTLRQMYEAFKNNEKVIIQ